MRENLKAERPLHQYEAVPHLKRARRTEFSAPDMLRGVSRYQSEQRHCDVDLLSHFQTTTTKIRQYEPRATTAYCVEERHPRQLGFFHARYNLKLNTSAFSNQLGNFFSVVGFPKDAVATARCFVAPVSSINVRISPKAPTNSSTVF